VVAAEVKFRMVSYETLTEVTGAALKKIPTDSGAEKLAITLGAGVVGEAGVQPMKGAVGAPLK